jgi:hypothetical protein
MNKTKIKEQVKVLRDGAFLVSAKPKTVRENVLGKSW